VNDSFLTFVNGGWSGNITGLSSIDGSDASENETGRLVKFENETWYSFKVRVESEKIICHVNSEKVVDFDPTGRSLKTRVESRPSQPLGFACYDSIGELDLAISDYSVALELDLRSGNEEVDDQEVILRKNQILV
jgi:hypothetical protein